MKGKGYGIVYILDALGASFYSDEKIEQFLNARKDINKILSKQAKHLDSNDKKSNVSTYTFGDTLIVVIPLDKSKPLIQSIQISFFMMQNYLFHSLEKGILYRGAFSIGNYIADEESNTVMGEAITDAASWYEKSEWMGLASTPKTNNIIEYEYEYPGVHDPMFVSYYPVPMKDKRKINLYTISWAGRFFHENDKYNPKQYFLKLLKEHPIPLGTENKIINTKNYFYDIEKEILSNKSLEKEQVKTADNSSL